MECGVLFSENITSVTNALTAIKIFSLRNTKSTGLIAALTVMAVLHLLRRYKTLCDHGSKKIKAKRNKRFLQRRNEEIANV